MSDKIFRFKQFNIIQDKCAMKIGMDACVFGSWFSSGKNFLDVGTGTGILALMAAQRFPEATVDAVDIDLNAFEQASENFKNSAWKSNLKCTHISFIDLDESVFYDHVISNPPYFNNALKSNSDQRDLARHDDYLSVEAFFQKAKKILSPDGKVSVIFPSDDKRLPQAALDQGFFVRRKCQLIPTRSKAVLRNMWEFGLNPCELELSDLIIEQEGSRRLTLSAWKLLKDFYLEC